jgi:O-antigen/teichoic acid export membrane protein
MLSVAARRPALGLNVTWTLVGNVGYAASQWAMLALIAKLGDARMVGEFALGLAIAGPVMLFASLQLRGIQATDAAGRYRFGQYLALRLVTNVVALLCLCGAGPVALVIGLGKACEGISDVCYGAFQQRERMDLISKSMLLKGGLSLVGMALALRFGLLAGVGAMALVSFGLAVGFDLPNARRMLGSLAPSWEELPGLAKLALPLGVVYLLTALTTNVPRYFLAHQVGTEGLGVFAALAYLTLVGATVVGALGQAASPRLARTFAEGRREEFRLGVAKLLAAGALIGVLGVFGALVAGREVVALAYRPAYAAHVDVLVWLMVAGGLGYVGSLLGYAMTAARAFRPQVPVTGLVLVSTAIGCAFWVPGHGLVGAAMGLLAGALVQCIAGFLVVWHVSTR